MPIMKSQFIQHIFGRHPLKITYDGLFEIIYAIMGQLFLTQSDEIKMLTDSLNQRFPF